MKFKIDLEQIKTRELIDIETSLKAATVLMSRFMVKENGEPVPQPEAYEMILDMNVDELTETQEAFTAAILPNLKSRRS